MAIRLDRFLADHGFALEVSKKIISKGTVKVDGIIIKRLITKLMKAVLCL